MKNKKAKKIESQFTESQLEVLLSGLTPNQAYYFTKRDNLDEYNQIVNLLPNGYLTRNSEKIESVDFVYSGSTESQFILTMRPDEMTVITVQRFTM